MKVPQIRMESQFAKIKIEQIPPTQEMKQKKAEISIEQPNAELSIRTKQGKLTIDQSKAWEEMNLMSILTRNIKHAEEGMKAIAEGTARRAEQGTALMKIENNSNPFVAQAIDNGERKEGIISLKYIPSVFSVQIDYIPAEVITEITPRRPDIQVTPQQMEHLYHQGEVKIGLARDPELMIDFVNLFPEKI